MALDKKKKQKRVSPWKLAPDKKPHAKLFKKNPEEPLLIHKNNFKIK